MNKTIAARGPGSIAAPACAGGTASKRSPAEDRLLSSARADQFVTSAGLESPARGANRALPRDRATASVLACRTRAPRGLKEALRSGALTLDAASQERVAEWAKDPAARRAIEDLLERGAFAELADAFAGELTFGTAGLRGEMGVGPNRMNDRVVRAATAAVAALVRELGAADRGVVVSYDTRRGSAGFAALARKILSDSGIRVYAFEGDRPTPEMSFAIRKTGAIAGVMITASHNPKEHNGYKVSWEHGGQIGAEIAEAILARMKPGSALGAQGVSRKGAVVSLGDELDAAYRASIVDHVQDREALAELKVVYDPLYGSGRRVLAESLLEAGLPKDNLTIVEEHARAPEGGELGDFAGLSSPNPSSEGALSRAIQKAEQIGADLVLASDPDADRLVAAVPEAGGGWRVLRANETWPLVLDHRLDSLKSRGELPRDGVVVRSWVTSALIDRVAGQYGLPTVETPTGFKWISEQMTKHDVIAGFEESDGMSVGTHTREKCAQLAAVLVAEAAGAAKRRGQTLLDRLAELHARHGVHEAIVEDLAFEGIEGRAAIQKIRSALAASPELVFSDPGTRIEQRYDGTRAHLPGSRVVTVRPSGTEPKVKVYVETVASGPELDARSAARDLLAEITARIQKIAT